MPSVGQQMAMEGSRTNDHLTGAGFLLAPGRKYTVGRRCRAAQTIRDSVDPLRPRAPNTNSALATPNSELGCPHLHSTTPPLRHPRL
jgi:hypothetical protein